MAPAATLHLISGLPCAGKTTYAERLRDEHDAAHLALDRWLTTAFGCYSLAAVGYAEHARRLYACRELIWSVASEFLRRGVDVILDDGFFLTSDRREHVARAREIGAAAAIHFVDTPVDVARSRLESRNRNPGRYTLDIAPAALDACVAVFQRPAEDEGAELIVVRGTNASSP